MGRPIRNAANQVASTASVIEQVAAQAATNGVRITGTASFKLPGVLTKFFGVDAISLDYDTVVRIGDAPEIAPEPDANPDNEVQ